MPKKQAFKHVKRVERKGGRVDYYHRIAKVRLPGEYGSTEFIEAWLNAERAASAAASTPAPPRGSTYSGLWSAFTESPDWQRLQPRTQADYLKVRDWMISINAGEAIASELEQRQAEKLIDRALKDKRHRFAVYVLQVNRRIYNWVLERASRQHIWGDTNPWANIKAPKPPRTVKKNPAWTPEEVAAVLARAPLGLARAYVLGASGFDGSTMWRLNWGDYVAGTFDNDRIKSGVSGHTIVPGPLRPLLEQGDRPSTRIITAPNGRPYQTLNSMQTASSRFLHKLADEGLVRKGLTMHGLRHTVGKAISESGGSLRAIQASLRHASTRMALHYSEAADRKRALQDVSEAVDEWFSIGTTSVTVLAHHRSDD